MTYPKKYTYLSDPAHGWLKVWRNEVTRLGFKPSAYSYISPNSAYAYLEEDRDMPAFLARKRDAGEAFEIVEAPSSNCMSHIRDYPRFPSQ